MPTRIPEVAVGLDFGTSGLKTVAVAADGDIVARAEASYPTLRPAPGRAEQDPRDWQRAAARALGSLAAAVHPKRWVALGLSGMIPTLVLTDADGAPVRPAITWEDNRAEPQAERLRRTLGPAAVYATTGQWLDGRYLLPMFAWVREHEPTPTERVAHLAGAKDYLFWWLTGTWATDPSTATGVGCFDLEAGRWSPEILAAAGWDGGPALPEVRPSDSTKPLRADAASALGLPQGLPVCLGAADSVLAARGLGATEPGQVAYVAGTSTVILAVSDGPRRDAAHRFLLTPTPDPGRWGLEMDLISSGATVSWLVRLIVPGADESEIWRLAEGSVPGAHGVALLPYLGHGEQGALWDPSLRGTIAGLSASHSREDLARALLEGLVLESRRCLQVLEGSGVPRGEILLVGRGGGAACFRTALADASGRRVEIPGGVAHPASAWGAASLAWASLGAAPPDPPADADALGAMPTPEATRVWDALWVRHEHLRQAVRRWPGPTT